ncbi:hypothetical protein OG242_17875 [Streptomyces sp. NBC_00727]|uniref:hypothetical protein n=1 Tax=Streptomyces sp. NBC_00727 TaxID=2903675 RepID=UPI003864790E
MGIESDQLVYDYLSRVGDLAQQQQLPSGARMRLVSELRAEIERQRTSRAAHTPGQVRRIIGTLGTPDELVAAAGRRAPEAPEIPGPRRARPSGDAPEEDDADASPDPGAAGPHRAGTDELGDGGEADWWLDEPGPFGESGPGAFGEFGPGTEVAGFRGGVEIPELLRPPVPEEERERAREEEPEGETPADDEEPEAAAPEKRRRRLPKLRRTRPAPAPVQAAAPRRGFSNPVLLLAAALLVTGAVMGSLLALAGGWLLAYSSRKLTRAEAKWAAMGLPGVVAAAALVWLWGRMDGRWGTPIPEHGMKDALGDVWPVTIRAAAVASALFLVWRARRR